MNITLVKEDETRVIDIERLKDYLKGKNIDAEDVLRTPVNVIYICSSSKSEKREDQ